MRRPTGVALVAILVVMLSLMILSAWRRVPLARMGPRILVTAAALAILALVAAEALWTLRSYAFIAFTLWSVCAVVALAMSRMPLASSGHGIRLLGPIACAGLAYVIVALYLRRVV